MHKFREVIAQEDGAILVFVTIVMVVLLGMAALAIDIGQMYIAKQRAQNVCDAAALAGGQLLTGKPACEVPAENAAIDCKDQNNDEVAPWQLDSFEAHAEITSVTFDDGRTASCDPGDAIKVTGRVHVAFAFAGIFGMTGLDIPADATALLGPARTVYNVDPLGVTPAIIGLPFGEPYDVGPVEQWQDSLANDPGNWLMLRLGDDSGMTDYVDRLRMEEDPVSVSVGDQIATQPGGSGGSGTGQSNTYDALVGTFQGPNYDVKEPGRILREPDPRFQASHFINADGYDEYYLTGYNPTAWPTWRDTENAQGLHPATNRILILPIINPEGLTGQSEVEVLGFAAFFVERVWDGLTSNGEIDPATGLPEIPLRGHIKGYFIQAITSGSADVGWDFEGTELIDDDSIREVYLIS